MIRSLLIVAVVGVTATLTAAPPMAASTPEELVAQLGDPDFATRERATKALLARGTLAVPALQKALQSPSPEIRHRAQELLQTIKWKDAFEPKRITIGPGTAKLGEALGAIATQSGVAISAHGSSDQPGAYGITNATLWEAVEHVTRISGHVVTKDDSSAAICLRPANVRPPFICLDGAFRVQLAAIHEDRDVFFTEPGVGKNLGWREDALTFTFPVLAEPRFMLLSAEPVQFLEAVDDRGRSFSEATTGKDRPRALPETQVFRRAYYPFAADGVLRRPDGAKAAKTLKGVIPVRIVVQRRRIAMPKPIWSKKGTSFPVGNDPLIVQGGEVLDSGDFHLKLEVPIAEQREEIRTWHDRVIVEDLWGNPLQRFSTGTGRLGDRVTIDVGHKMPEGWLNSVSPRVFIEEWVILRHRVKFQFQDVPLP